VQKATKFNVQLQSAIINFDLCRHEYFSVFSHTYDTLGTVQLYLEGVAPLTSLLWHIPCAP